MTLIREEQKQDIDAIFNIHKKELGESEAQLVRNLRKNQNKTFSLVAEINNEIVGHIMFSTVILNNITGMGLAPMAVSKKYQKQGFGKQLIQRSLDELKQKNCPFVIVLGHTDYYTKFGFKPASTFGIKPQWEGLPDEAFMAIVWNNNAVKENIGTVYYSKEFNNL